MTIHTATFGSRRTRHLSIAFCGVGLALLFSSAATLPFLFESFSLTYKFGLQKMLLRSGKLVGLAAALLLVGQLILAARLTWVNRLVGMDHLLTAHKFNGVFLALLALIHPLLVFGPEEISTLPLEARYWPEIVGAGLLMGLFYMTAAALFRRKLAFPFHLWMRSHQIGGGLVMTALFVHLLFSSETFETGLPRSAGLSFAAVCLLVFLRRHGRPFRGLTSWHVSEVAPAGKRATRVCLKADGPGNFFYLPGQFAFLSFPSSIVSPEPHPFSMASTPTQKDALEFIIGKNGDWTRGIDCLRKGEIAHIDGPYGHFSHCLIEDETPLVLIAGGIGITPLISMLRFMEATGDHRKTLLIWSNRNDETLFHTEELIRVKKNHPQLTVHLLFTGEPGEGRLTSKRLHQIIGPLSRPQVFLCGPPPMQASVTTMLKEIGIPCTRIHTETFGF
ncbi:ferric reductase-like transmembrane domain-containing protein [Desulfoluna sp.]|uniref:ferredoxin reductase family protein n=1 Tax=Desulfoluna sp. TaxID=2045199 RepID=UPI00261B8522|nr:ferric reductase-like transmembrane domain-containing protein [Desulfoluna sp.]